VLKAPLANDLGTVRCNQLIWCSCHVRGVGIHHTSSIVKTTEQIQACISPTGRPRFRQSLIAAVCLHTVDLEQ
jgi:hypothetical protein